MMLKSGGDGWDFVVLVVDFFLFWVGGGSGIIVNYLFTCCIVSR